MTAFPAGISLCVGIAVALSPAASVAALLGGSALTVDPVGACLSVSGNPLFMAGDQLVCSYLSI